MTAGPGAFVAMATRLRGKVQQRHNSALRINEASGRDLKETPCAVSSPVLRSKRIVYCCGLRPWKKHEIRKNMRDRVWRKRCF